VNAYDSTANGDGVVLSGFDYDRVSGTTTRYFPPLRFPGQYYDEESDLYENWNRYYNPSTGRYLSPEPLLQSPGYVATMAQSGMSVPTYAYALNNPVRYTDLNGLNPGDPFRTPYEAAIDAIDFVSDVLPNDVEWGGTIYRGPNNSKGQEQWFATMPVTDNDPHSCTPSRSPPPSGMKVAAYYHIHPTSPYFSHEDMLSPRPDVMRRPDGSVVLGAAKGNSWVERELRGPRSPQRMINPPRAAPGIQLEWR
jgi:RHS repeat-associated protein